MKNSDLTHEDIIRLNNKENRKRNIKMVIEYRGTEYYGFQKQKDKRTIQAEIEKCLENILKEKVNVITSGRTDSGTHANYAVINFYTNSNIDEYQLLKATNMTLEKTKNKYISVKECTDVPLYFHSNISLKSKTYMYILNTEYISGLYRDLEYFYKEDLDIDLMKKAAKKIVGEKDFSCFCNSGSESKTFVKNISKISIEKIGPRIYFKITGNGFLYKMVRNIVGTLFDVGRGKIKLKEIDYIIESKDRKLAGRTMPAHGLYLYDIKY